MTDAKTILAAFKEARKLMDSQWVQTVQHKLVVVETEWSFDRDGYLIIEDIYVEAVREWHYSGTGV